MKRMRLVAVAIIVIASLLVSALGVSAQSGTWVSGIMVQNQSETEAADITITFYWAEGEALAGQVAYTHYDTIAAGKAKSYYVPSLAGLPENFVGSAVVSSNQPIAANLNTQLPSGAGATMENPNRVGTASGVLTGSTKLYFTQLMKAYYGWNSYMAVQNTSADTQASATVVYYNAAGTQVATQTVTIKPNTTYIFRQADNANLAAGFEGSAVVTGNQALAGVANFYAAGTDAASAQFQSYNAFGSGATKLYVPRLVKGYYGYEGGIKVQNVGTAATDVTITYYFGANNYAQTISNLAPGAASSVYMGGSSAPAVLAGVTGSGGAVITSSGQPIVATVNEDNRSEGRGITYNAILDGTQTTAVLFPQMTSRYYGYSGGPQVQNVGSSAATVTATFSAPGFPDVTNTINLAPNASYSWFTPNVVSGAGFNGSVVVVANQPIVGIANFSYRADVQASDGWAANYGDSYVTYNGINK
jgi:hypothetical protein